jgi:hypothetical protein
MLTRSRQSRVSPVLMQGEGAPNPGPLALHPLPRFGGHSHGKENTRSRCTRFRDHPALETIPRFGIIRGLEYAALFGVVLEIGQGGFESLDEPLLACT